MPERRERELTFAQAVREALAEEMRRDSTRVHFRRRRGRGRNAVQSAFRAGRRIRRRTSTRYTDLRSWLHRSWRRRCDDGPATRGRHHVRRFPDADHGSDGQPGRQSSLHVGRTLEGPDGDAHDAGCNSPLGCAAFAVAARVVQSRAGIESRVAVDSVRREGPAEDGDPRREPGRLLRRQNDVQAERPGSGGRLHDPVWESPT